MKGLAIEKLVARSEVRKLLLGYAYKIVSSPLLKWPGEGDLRQLAEDVVSEAVCKTVIGDRTWNPVDSISESGLLSEGDEKALLAHLLGAIQSIAINRNRNDENKVKKVAADVPEAATKAAPNPPAHEKLEADEFFYGLLVDLGDDDVCCRILDLYEKGFKPEDVGEKLGLSKDELYAANKRLKRKARAYLQKLRAES